MGVGGDEALVSICKGPVMGGRKSTFLRVFCEYVLDVILATCSENLAEILSSVQALSGKPVDVLSLGVLGRFLTMTDHVEDWRCLA